MAVRSPSIAQYGLHEKLPLSGRKVWFSDSGNPKRKYPCTWELGEIPVMYDAEEHITLAG